MPIHNLKLLGKICCLLRKKTLIWILFTIRLKDGKPLTPDLGFESQYDVKTGQITLKHKGATPKQAGELVCRVENSAGTTDAPITLDVHSKW